MADISKLKVPAGTNGALVEYDVKDSTARSSIPAAASATPSAPGTAAVGTSTKYAREDHVHQGYSNATSTTAGLMSAADKARLDGISGIVISETEPVASEPTIWIDPSDDDSDTVLVASDMASFLGITLTTVRTITGTV